MSAVFHFSQFKKAEKEKVQIYLNAQSNIIHKNEFCYNIAKIHSIIHLISLEIVA
jgi:hypothetical protein